MKREKRDNDKLNSETKKNGVNVVGLKVDVDTHHGMKRGVPRLLTMLKEYGARGTFYLSMGPDASGRAALHLLRNPRFIEKAVRTDALRLYGLKTALYGTLLPSPMIALAFPELVEKIVESGNEAEFHAWNHRVWQDELPERSADWIREWFGKGVAAYAKVVGKPPVSFGAPGWLIDDRALRIAKEFGFSYLSCTRAIEPFVHAGVGLLEIPSDLPSLEERGGKKWGLEVLAAVEKGGVHVLPVHAEVEGGAGAKYFEELLKDFNARGVRMAPLSEIKDLINIDELPVRKYRLKRLPGRAFPCAV